MSEIQLKATNVENKPVRIGDLPIIKTNILENAGQMDKGVVGGYNGAFPLTAASEGGIYLLPSTGKFYVCETAYNGAQISAPNSNFVELSVWKNHDRLNNLKYRYTNTWLEMNSRQTLEIGIEYEEDYIAFFLFGHHNLYSNRSFSGIFFGNSLWHGVSYNPLIPNDSIEITEGKDTPNKKLKIKNNNDSQFMVHILALTKADTKSLKINKY